MQFVAKVSQPQLSPRLANYAFMQRFDDRESVNFDIVAKNDLIEGGVGNSPDRSNSLNPFSFGKKRFGAGMRSSLTRHDLLSKQTTNFMHRVGSGADLNLLD